MAALSNHVSIAITQDSVGIKLAGFGIPLILSATAAWATDKIRFYGSLDEVITDFATTTGPEYLAAQALFGQSPAPETIAIGKTDSTRRPTMRYSLAATARDSHAYTMTVKGAGVTSTDLTVTSDSAATVAEVHKLCVDALNGVTGKNYLAAYAALVNPDDTFTAAGTDVCTAVAHGLVTGDGPFQLTTSAADLPDGLLTATDYWIIKLDADTFKLATSLALALAGTPVDILDAGTGTHTIADTASTVRPSDPFTVTGSAAGNWFALDAVSADDFAMSVNHSDPGIATDLAAINVVDNTWYCLITLYNSDAYVKAAAAWVEANKKIYIADVSETEAITDAADGTQGTLDDISALNYTRTAGVWHNRPSEMIAAAWAGDRLPLDAGSETWKYAQLAGVSAPSITSTQRTNLVNRSANFYETVAGVSIMSEGTTADGGYIDTRRGLDWIESDMSAGVFTALAGANKVPYTNAGIAIVEAQVRATLLRAVKRQIIADDPAFTVTVPRVADVSAIDKAARILRNVKFSATLAGAIHKVVISGVVSV